MCQPGLLAGPFLIRPSGLSSLAATASFFLAFSVGGTAHTFLFYIFVEALHSLLYALLQWRRWAEAATKIGHASLLMSGYVPSQSSRVGCRTHGRYGSHGDQKTVPEFDVGRERRGGGDISLLAVYSSSLIGLSSHLLFSSH